MQIDRQKKFNKLFPKALSWRKSQMISALFDAKINNWMSVSSLPNDLRKKMTDSIPWMSVTQNELYESRDKQTHKALLALTDGNIIETVLMKNKREQFSVCVSSQVGCAMGCIFCATGQIGLKRNLTTDEIVDQLRFWQYFLRDYKINDRISNIVIMGMGEPLANYENVKTAIEQWLKYTDIGANHITVSTVGILAYLNKILTDKNWPPVRVAISLHSANETTRKKIVPTTGNDYLHQLSQWAKKYLETKGANKRHLTFEYVLLSDINDSTLDAKMLGNFAAAIGHVKINLIPFNNVLGKNLQRSQTADQFATIVKKYGITTTIRQSAGQDIMAACGQLSGKKNKVG